MIRSLAVVLVLVGLLLLFNWAQQPDPVVRDVGYDAAVAQARQEAPYDVLAPDPLPDGWRATSARTRAVDGEVSWHLGLVTRSGAYAAVEQSDWPSRQGFVERFAAAGETRGHTTISGVPWRQVDGGDPEPRALVRSADGVTTVVAGSASWGELTQLAGSLRTAP
jgi:hypothetical protein